MDCFRLVSMESFRNCDENGVGPRYSSEGGLQSFVRATCHTACICLASAIRWMPVIFLVGVFAWSYYTFVVELVYFRITSLATQAALLAVYHGVVILCAWSFGKTIKTPPGKVPPAFRLSEEQSNALATAKSEAEWKSVLETMVEELSEMAAVRQRSLQGAVRYCEPCQCVKPDRAHHCSVCGHCVLKMDHHCPWVNNCVGFANYKFFYLFLSYAYAYCLILIGSMAKFAYTIVFALGEVKEGLASGDSLDVSYHILFIFVIASLFFIFLSSLFWYHTYLLTRNRSTLEQFRAPTFTHGVDESAFNMGCLENFKQVFGDRPSAWFIPWDTTKGNGLSFPMRHAEFTAVAPANDRNRRESDQLSLAPPSLAYHSAESTSPSMTFQQTLTTPTSYEQQPATTPTMLRQPPYLPSDTTSPMGQHPPPSLSYQPLPTSMPPLASPDPTETTVYYHNHVNDVINNVMRSTFTMSANETQV
jgi:hypothetical protein